MNIIDYIIKHKGLKQKDIASLLNVSRAQISKWKAGEYISYTKQEELNHIAGLWGDDSEWAILAKNKENAENWFKYFAYQEEHALEGYDTGDFTEEENAIIAVPSILKKLYNLGVKIPENAPTIPDEESDEEYENTNFDNLISAFITNYGYIVHWWENATDWLDDLDLYENINSIRYEIDSIALSHIDEDTRIRAGITTENFNKFFQEEKRFLIDHIQNLCKGILKAGYPITIDFYKVIFENPYILDDETFFDQTIVSVNDFSSIGEKNILKEIYDLKKQIEELHKKIDKIDACTKK